MQRHQKQRDRYCLLSTGWLPCLPASRAASLVTGWSSQCSGKSLYYWAVWSLLSNPLDKGLLWVARMQANLEPKLPPITPQVQKHFIQNPIMCVPTSSNLNTFLERSYCLGQGLLYSQWPMRRHLLWQWQWLGSFSKKKMATRLTFLRKLHTKGPRGPLSCLWSTTVIPALKLWLHSSPLLWDTPPPWPLSQVHNEGRQCLSICFIHLCLNSVPATTKQALSIQLESSNKCLSVHSKDTGLPKGQAPIQALG